METIFSHNEKQKVELKSEVGLVSVRENIISHATPCVGLKVNNRRYTALLDSGACVSIVKAETFEQLPEFCKFNVRDTGATLVDVSGKKLKCKGLVEIDAFLGRKKIRFVAHVVENLNTKTNFILGINVFRQFNFILNAAEDRLEVGDHFEKLCYNKDDFEETCRMIENEKFFKTSRNKIFRVRNSATVKIGMNTKQKVKVWIYRATKNEFNV